MAVPGRVESLLNEDEPIDARVALGDDAVLYVTPTRAIVYKASSLLREESLTTVATDVERIVLDEGRKSATVTFEHGLREPERLSIPLANLEESLPAILEGVLRASGVLDTDESVARTFRFSELTVIVTDRRLLKHIGRALWASDFEAFAFDDIVGLRTEEGRVATGVVLEFETGTERFKVPQSATRRLMHELESALCAYHGVEALDQLRPDDGEEEPTEPALEDELEPLLGDPAEAFEWSAGRSNREDPVVQLDELREAIERHEELLDRLQERLDRLEDELSRDR